MAVPLQACARGRAYKWRDAPRPSPKYFEEFISLSSRSHALSGPSQHAYADSKISSFRMLVRRVAFAH